MIARSYFGAPAPTVRDVSRGRYRRIAWCAGRRSSSSESVGATTTIEARPREGPSSPWTRTQDEQPDTSSTYSDADLAYDGDATALAFHGGCCATARRRLRRQRLAEDFRERVLMALTEPRDRRVLAET